MAEILKLNSPGTAIPVPGQFIETETAADILHSLEVVYKGPGEYVGLICGAPGIGKSETIWRFKHKAGNVFIHKAVQGEGGVWNLANELCRILDIEEPNGRRLPEERRRIAEAFGAGSMLIVDGSQYLVQRNTRGKDDWQAFEWLRGMAEDGALSLAFCGDLRMRKLEEISPPLWRRMRRRCVVSRAPKADVQALAGQWGIYDLKAVDVLFAASRKGGLGDVVNLCREARNMAGKTAISLDHILAALEDLKLLPRGRK